MENGGRRSLGPLLNIWVNETERGSRVKVRGADEERKNTEFSSVGKWTCGPVLQAF